MESAHIRRVPGFGSVPIGGLILLWSCQPRIAWFDVFRLLKGLDEGKCYPKLAPTMGRELLLEIVATVYMGIATHFASWRGYYQVKFSDLAVPLDAKLFYAGAACSLVMAMLCLLNSSIRQVMLLRSDKGAFVMRSRYNFTVGIYAPCASIPYIGTWMFWGGFTTLSGDL